MLDSSKLSPALRVLTSSTSNAVHGLALHDSTSLACLGE
nr:MAG TPA: hypothetical protein [Caudoviricetes sp.]